ncbi:phenolic acid decarboxylase [Pengzhenrongella sp.]|jgi:phenolic acid decarboxylase|uniref:phenolic acid decarboxylase n=1 Tax=Pengzhenrongella sp. TaxID=2888820 RepID=UPI002F91F293
MTELLVDELTQDLTGIVGLHAIYTYANGWQYELYVKNATTIDYRIHSGMVGGRWVRDQAVDVVRVDDGVYKIAWTEPTGTSVALDVVPAKRRLHGVIFFPHWVEQHPERTVCFQNDHLAEMARYREAGPAYPVLVVPEFARISFLEDCGPDDESVVDRAPGDLPAGYAARTN